MKVSSLNMITKDGDFVDVLLNINLTQQEAKELNVNMGTIFNLIYNKAGICFAHGILEGGDLIEFSLTVEEIKHVNKFLYENGIYREVVSMILDKKVS